MDERRMRPAACSGPSRSRFAGRGEGAAFRFALSERPALWREGDDRGGPQVADDVDPGDVSIPDNAIAGAKTPPPTCL